MERTFGIMKKRFRVLRLPCLYRTAEKVDNVFKTCCILHNWLMTANGLDTMGHLDGDWIEQSPDQITARRRVQDLINGTIRSFAGSRFLVHDGTDFSRVGGSQAAHPEFCIANQQSCMCEKEPGYFARVAALVQHYHAVSSPDFDSAPPGFSADVPLWLKTAADARPHKCPRV